MFDSDAEVTEDLDETSGPTDGDIGVVEDDDETVVSEMLSEFTFSRTESTAIARQQARQSLMMFSPAATVKRKSRTLNHGSARKLAQVTPTKRVR